jgi:hypothetical protein
VRLTERSEKREQEIRRLFDSARRSYPRWHHNSLLRFVWPTSICSPSTRTENGYRFHHAGQKPAPKTKYLAGNPKSLCLTQNPSTIPHCF